MKGMNHAKHRKGIDFRRKLADAMNSESPAKLSGAITEGRACKPLPHAELVALILESQAGDAARNTLDDEVLLAASVDTETTLRARVRRGERARNKVILANMRLVFKLTYPMVRAAGLLEGMPDILQDAVMGPRGSGGLVRAIEKYDTARNERFTTYATAWIRVAVRDAINVLSDGQLRGGAQQRAMLVREVGQQLEAELGRKPSAREVRARCVLKGHEVPTDRSLEHAEYSPNATFVECTMIPEPSDLVEELETRELARKALATLDGAEAQALQLYGRPGKPFTYEEIAAALSCSREHARKLVARAIEKVGYAMADGGACLDPSDYSRATPTAARRRASAAGNRRGPAS